jgi:hypothetical protein
MPSFKPTKGFGKKFSDYYKPHEQQLKFHSSTAKYRLFGGAKGGGKSIALLWEAINWCLRVPGCSVLLLRRTFPDLNKTLLSHFETKIPQEIYGGTRHYNRNDHVVTFDNGSKLWFGSCQHEYDVYSYNGAEFVFIGIDEGTEWVYRMWEFLTLQNRCPIKFDIYGNAVIPCMAMASNPGGVGHDFVKRGFILKQKPDPEMSNYNPDDWEFIRSSVYDNPAYKDDKSYLTTLESANPEWRARYLLGSWDTIAGLYFSKFDPAITKLDKFVADRLVHKQTWHKKWIGIDWGYQHHTAVFWATMCTWTDELGEKFDKLLIYRELVINQTGERALAQMIVDACRFRDDQDDECFEDIESVYLSPDAFAKRTSSNTIAEEIGAVLTANRMPYPAPADDDRVGGARLVDEMLSARPIPEMLISERCEELLAAIPMLQRDDKEIEDVKKTKQKLDDVWDGYRYTVKSHGEAGKTPFQVERQRILAQCPDGNTKLFADLALRKKHQQGAGITFTKRRSFGGRNR